MKCMCAVTCLWLAGLIAVAAQDPDTLSEAKKLYESAQYERALAALERIDATAVPPERARDRLLYQALCLLALDDPAGTEAKVSEILHADPLFVLPREFPPRLGAIIDDVRARLRPKLAQAHYAAGKDRFEAGDYESALRELTLAIEIAGGDRSGENGGSSLTDVKLLAEGFRDLSRRAKDEAAKTGVTPPIVIRQEMPAWPPALTSYLAQREGGSLIGVLQVIVSRTGDVDSATLVRRIHPVYDALLLAATREWKYEPATRNGEPIEYVKRLNVKVAAK